MEAKSWIGILGRTAAGPLRTAPAKARAAFADEVPGGVENQC